MKKIKNFNKVRNVQLLIFRWKECLFISSFLTCTYVFLLCFVSFMFTTILFPCTITGPSHSTSQVNSYNPFSFPYLLKFVIPIYSTKPLFLKEHLFFFVFLFSRISMFFGFLERECPPWLISFHHTRFGCF